MPQRIVDVFDKDDVWIATYAVLIAAFNRTLNDDDFVREAVWMATRDKVAPADQLAWLTAKVRLRSGLLNPVGPAPQSRPTSGGAPVDRQAHRTSEFGAVQRGRHMPERVVDVFDKDGGYVTSYAVILAGSDETPDQEYEREALRMAAFDDVVPADLLASLTAKVRS